MAGPAAADSGVTPDVRVAVVDARYAGELYTVQRAGYVSEAQLYSPHIPPLVETLDQVRADLESAEVLAFGAWLGERLIGSVRGRPAGDRMEVARFAVAPDLQGRGVGRALLAAVEAATPAGVRTLWLRTGARSHANLRLYQRAGYRVVGEELDAIGVTVALLAKTREWPRRL